MKILDTLASKLIQPANSVFNTYEDGRLGRIVTSILLRNLISIEDFEKWLVQFDTIFKKSMWFDTKDNLGNSYLKLYARTNTRMFLSMIYFMILFEDKELVQMKEFALSDLIKNKQTILDLLTSTIKRIDSEGYFKKD